MSKILKLNFSDFDDAWDGINDFMLNNENEIKKGYGGPYGTELCCYNTIINVSRARLSPDWNFGKTLGYTDKKWSKLVLNYLDMNYLDLVRAEVAIREEKGATSYNHVVHFDNSHGSGKDCLISLIFERRLDSPNPTVIYHTRASEVTKRLPFDLLLIQRMAEYVYGPDMAVECLMFIPFMYTHVENCLMYMHHKGGPDKVLRPQKDTGKLGMFQKRVTKRFHDFMDTPLEKITYQVHKKAAAVIQGKREVGDLFAKDLQLKLRAQANKLNVRLQTKLNKGLLLNDE